MSPRKKKPVYQRKNKDGREMIFEEPSAFLAAAYGYFAWCDENPWHESDLIKSGSLSGEVVQVPVPRPYTVEGLCVHCGISTGTFRNMEKDERFSKVATHVRDIILQHQIEGACNGVYNATVVSRLLGLADIKEVSGRDGLPLVINVTSSETKKEIETLKEHLSK